MNSIYKKNLDVLEKLSPTVAERMKGLDAGIVLDDFFRDNDPASVAREFVDRFDIPEEADMHVISGAGLWHHVRELARRRNDRTWLVVIEGRDDIFRAAIDRVDISDILMSPRVAFFAG
ncbi:MAG: hypothetical protein ACE5EK_11285, partial [Nitrospinales bacterium]